MSTQPDLNAVDRQMARDDGGPAFPEVNGAKMQHAVQEIMASALDNDTTRMNRGVEELKACAVSGMSLRDYFAGQAATGLASAWDKGGVFNSEAEARLAYALADAMLKERKR